MTLLGIFDHFLTGEFLSHWLWALAFALLGLLFGWLVWGRLVSGLRAQVAKLEGEIEDWKKKYAKLQKVNEGLELDLKNANADINKKAERIRQLELEKGQLHGDLMAARQVRDAQGKELDAIKARFTSLEEEKLKMASAAADTSELDALRARLEESNTLNASLRGKISEVETNAASAGASAGEVAELKAKLAEVEAQANAHQRTIRDLNMKLTEAGDSNGELATLQAKLTKTEQEYASFRSNATDKGELDSLRTKLSKTEADLAECRSKAAASPGIVAGAAMVSATGGSGAAPSKEEKAARAASARDSVKKKLKPVAAGDKDDLKLISGVGPALEKKLNGLGIFTFEQVAAFDTEMVEEVNDAIEFFPGRVQRDDWVGQAKKLYQTKMSNPASLTATKNPSNPEDLKIVEGIGPKIEQLLKNGGIKTWRDLAGTSVDRLKSILDAAGDRYRIHDPGTWPEQAQLAADGDWEKLKEYQDFLEGGRTK